MMSRDLLSLLGAGIVILSCAGEIRLVSTNPRSSDAGSDRDGAPQDPGGCGVETDCPGGLHCDIGLRSCVACVVDAHCGSGDRPRCDAALHRCVECGVASDCEPTERCQPETRRCVATCGDGGTCPSDAPFCDEARGLCLECLGDGDCTEGDRSRCDAARGLCVACRTGGDCEAESPLCTSEGQCVECAGSSDCPPEAPFCDPEAGECKAL